MRRDSENRSRYLSLALTSRKIIDSLRAVATGEPLGHDLDNSLHKLLLGTQSEGEEQFLTHLQGSGDWTHFEELSTVDELKNETGTDLGEVISSVLNNTNEEARLQSARHLIAFLMAVEGRALQQYTDSMEPQIA